MGGVKLQKSDYSKFICYLCSPNAPLARMRETCARTLSDIG